MPVEETFVDERAFLEAFRAREERRPDHVWQGIKKAILEYVPWIEMAAPMGVTGALRQSAHAEISEYGHAALICDAPYAAMVEVGSRPHWMPLEPLLKWVQVKLAISDEAEAYKVARAIQRKIANEGTRPTWFMKKRLPGLNRVVMWEIKEAMYKGDSDGGK